MISSLSTFVLIVSTALPLLWLVTRLSPPLLMEGTGDVDLRAVSGIGGGVLEEDDCRRATLTGPDKDIRLLLRGKGDDDMLFSIFFLV